MRFNKWVLIAVGWIYLCIAVTINELGAEMALSGPIAAAAMLLIALGSSYENG